MAPARRCRRRTGSPCCRWRAGTVRPTAARPISCDGAGDGSQRAGVDWCGARQRRCVPTVAPTRTSWSSTRPPSTRSLRCGGLLDPEQVAGLQLTHSGRWSRPDGDTAAAHCVPASVARSAGGSRGTTRCSPTTNSTSWPTEYVAAAVLAQQAGFDFVDVKHCHGYLLHELLSAYDREGRYGGDLAGRTEFLRVVVAGIRERAPGLAIGVRLSAFDLVPYIAGDGGVGSSRVDRAVPVRLRGRWNRARDRSHRDPCAARPVRRSRHRTGQHHRGQPVLQPAHPAPGLLPAVGRLPAARGPAGRGRSAARRHRRAHVGASRPHDRRVGLLVPAGLVGPRRPGGGRRRAVRRWSASAG